MTTRRNQRTQQRRTKTRAGRLHRTSARTSTRRRGDAPRALRRLTVFVVVGGLIAVSALPGYGVGRPDDAAARTLQQVAVDDAQSLVIASGVSRAEISRESYSATTQEEIDEKKAKEAAAAAAAARARNAGRTASVPFDYSMVTAGSGAVRWPLGGPFTVGDRFGARGGAHMGTDMLAAGGTPVFAAVDGVVRISQDNYGAYGVAVALESVLGGQRVGTVYPHMRYGSRQVVPGETVTAGQLLGYVGSTGRSTANHLHFEVYIEGRAIDSLAWLQANAG
ncbi:M23 family metallopeptidase [Microbacterium trichothecenolyticum]